MRKLLIRLAASISALTENRVWTVSAREILGAVGPATVF
jgi:hypothetical protein